MRDVGHVKEVFTPIIFLLSAFCRENESNRPMCFMVDKNNNRELFVNAWILFLSPANHTVSPQEKNKTKSHYISFQADRQIA